MKTQLSKMIQSGGFLGRLLGPLLKTGLPLMKNVIKPFAKSVLVPLGVTAEDQQQLQEYINKSLDLVNILWTWLFLNIIIQQR